MRNLISKALLALLVIGFSSVASAQGKVIIKNNSIRQMTIKLMKGSGGKGVFQDSVVIAPNSSETIIITKPGAYFTKMKAELEGEDPIYQKGRAFTMYVGVRGATEMTLTFTIKEDKDKPTDGSEGVRITRTEYDHN